MKATRLALLLLLCSLTCCEQHPLEPVPNEAPAPTANPSPTPNSPEPPKSEAPPSRALPTTKIDEIVASIQSWPVAPDPGEPITPSGYLLIQKIIAPTEFHVSESLLDQTENGIDFGSMVEAAAQVAGKKAVAEHPTATEFMVNFRYLGFSVNEPGDIITITYEFVIYLYDGPEMDSTIPRDPSRTA